MGEIKKPSDVKLIFSLITNKESLIDEVVKILCSKYGEIDLLSERFPFDYTDYYTEEMGENLFRRFLVIKPLISREHIAEVKVFTNEVEKKFSINGKRQINIDPGYLTLENFILFTTKNYTHRIYLESGIYADLTLIYQKKEYHPLPWTYPDYAEKIVRDFLKKIRERYKEQLKETSKKIG